MKEADLEFDKMYAVKVDDDRIYRARRLIRKEPVRPGQKRSRTYVVQDLRGSSYLVDATAIKMPWSEYEKDERYRTWLRADTEAKLNQQITSAWNEWLDMFAAYLNTYDDISAGVGYPSRQLINKSETIDEALDALFELHSVSIPLRKVLEVYNIPIPRYDSVREAMETKAEFLRALDTTSTDSDNDGIDN